MAWTKYKEVKYAAAGIPSENLTDFPVPVWIDGDTDIAAECSGGGGIKFTSADGTADLSFGLYPSTDLTAGDVHARVKLSPLTAASVGDVIARIYYSSSESTTEDKAGTVDNGYVLFMPLEEDPSGSAPQMLDWVSESNVGTSEGSMTSGDLVAGQVGDALDFDGSDDGISGTCGGASNNQTIEAIIKSNTASGWRVVAARGTIPRNLLTMGKSISGKWFVSGASTDTDAFSSGDYDTNWHHMAGVLTNGAIRLYLDGSSIANRATSITIQNDAFFVGRNGWSATDFWSGFIDEVRVSSVARSADWLAYAYTTDFNLADLWTLSAEQGASSGGRLLNLRRRAYS